MRALAFSPDGKILASSSLDGTLILWDIASRQPLGPPLTGHRGWITSLAFSPDGKTPMQTFLDSLPMAREKLIDQQNQPVAVAC